MPTVPTTLRCSAQLTVALSRERAMALFTPEGERRWAAGWDPRYPEPDRREGPGTVFTTGHAGTWIMVDQLPERVRYARVVHGMTAGTVAVEAVGSSERSTELRVNYDLTALGADGEAWLEAFGADYVASIEGWSAQIEGALRAPAGTEG